MVCQGDYLITGDKDLLEVQRLESTLILSPADFCTSLRAFLNSVQLRLCDRRHVENIDCLRSRQNEQAFPILTKPQHRNRSREDKLITLFHRREIVDR